jgi:hypothetical protein
MKATRVLVSMLLLPTSVAAKTVVMPIDATNLAPGEIAAIATLIAQNYGRQAGTPTVAIRADDPALAGNATAAATAKAVGADSYVTVSAVRLAEKISLRATLCDASGAELHSVEMLAASLDDMPQVASRLARALVERKTAEQVISHRTVTREESSKKNRLFTERVKGLKGALSLPLAAGLEFNPMVTIQFDGRWEADNYFLEFGVGFKLPSSGGHQTMGAIFTEFGASRYLSDDDNALYAGAGVTPRILMSSIDNQVDIAPYAQLGFMMFRPSSSRLYFDLRVTQTVIPLHRDAWIACDYGQGSCLNPPEKQVFPTEVGLFFGIGW